MLLHNLFTDPETETVSNGSLCSEERSEDLAQHRGAHTLPVVCDGDPYTRLLRDRISRK